MTKKRIGIYLLFSFGIVWGMTIPYIMAGGEYEDSAMTFILIMSMLAPTISVVITRLLTKEGFAMTGKGSLLLGIDLKNKKWVWFLIALVLPIIYVEWGYLLYYGIFPEALDWSALDQLWLPKKLLFLMPLYAISNSVLFSFQAMGEEIGWRSYLYPKLEEVYGTGKALVFGGIIWGVWHFPAIYAGHNFGHGYWGEPFSGFFVFTIFAIAVGTVLYFLTKKTGSVWPAAFMHAVNNHAFSTSILGAAFNSEKLSGIALESTVMMVIIYFPLVIIAGVVWGVMRKQDLGKNVA